MMGSFGAGKHADLFAALIDGETPEREPSDELAQFAAIVASIRDLDAVEMRPDFASSLRERLMAEAPEALADLVVEPPANRARPVVLAASRRHRFVRAAAATCLVLGVTGGVAAASQSALPGDPLYGVKRALERIDVGLDRSDAAKGEDLVNQASTRLDEVNDLAMTRPDDADTARLIEETLATFSDQANQGADSLISSYEDTSDPAPIVDLRDFATNSADDLDHLGSIVPPEARDDIVDAAKVVTRIDKDARDTCAACSPLEPLELPASILSLAEDATKLLGLPQTQATDNDPDQGGQGKPGGDKPTVNLPTDLPTLPAVPHLPGGGATTTPDDNGGGGGGQTSKPPVQLPTLPLPSIPLPSVPVPSLPLPSLPLPSLPLPSLPIELPNL